MMPLSFLQSLHARLALLVAAALISACSTTPSTAPLVPAQQISAPTAAAAPVAQAAATPQPSANTQDASATLKPVLGPDGELVMEPPPFETTAKPIVNRDLWVRIRSGFKMQDLQTPLAEDRTRWYAAQTAYFNRMAARSSRYLFHIVEEIERRGLPTELALLPFVESAFNPVAHSSAKASGIWQFIPSTGKQYNLQQNMFRDDRRHVTASTDAALDYLSRLHGMFGDWHLALAAYNWGEGSVMRAQKKNQRESIATAYTDLRMPLETQQYVPKLQAIKNIVADPEKFGIALPEVPNHPYFETVRITRDIDVALVAKLADVSVTDFQALNPSFNKPTILGALGSEILLPYENAELFKRNMEKHRGALASWTAVVLSKNEKPASLAQRYGISEAQLRQINNIPPRMVMRAGSALMVPRAAAKQQDVSESIAQNGSLLMSPEAPPLRRASHKVRAGESLATIAKRYRTNPAQLAGWNKGVNAVKTGQVLTVYVPQRTAVAKATKSTKATNAGTRGKAVAQSNTKAKHAGKGKATVAKANSARQPATKGVRVTAKSKLAKR
jgi:membrane-bound lytic murein transglycosylase D